MLASSKLAEIPCCFWNRVIEKLENNTTRRLWIDGNVKLSSAWILGAKTTRFLLVLTNTLDLEDKEAEDEEVLESLNIV